MKRAAVLSFVVLSAMLLLGLVSGAAFGDPGSGSIRTTAGPRAADGARQTSTPVTETAEQGTVRAELSYLKVTGSTGFTMYRDLRLTISREGQVVDSSVPPHSGSLDGLWPGQSSKNGKSVHVADLDGDRVPEVEVDIYTGGAHCCRNLYAYRWNGTRYVSQRMQTGSSPYRQADLDHDGRPEWVTADPRFEYLFTSFAGSGVPVRIYGYRDGNFVVVTGKYPSLVRKDAALWWRIYQARRSGSGQDVRGFLAAWAADMYLLGEGAKVWPALSAANARGELNGLADFGWSTGLAYISKLRQKLGELGYSQAQPPQQVTSPAASPPVAGTPSGTVLVNGKPYRGGPIPYGSNVDVTKGKVTLKASVGTLAASGAAGISAQFTLLSGKDGGKPIVELRLSGGDFAVCKQAARSSAGLAAPKPPPKVVRRLWGKGKGAFRTRGRYAATTIRGTDWLTEDRCDGTFVRVRQGTVAVFDFRLKKTILVTAGHSYLAKSTSTSAAPAAPITFKAYAQQVDRLLRESAVARKRLQNLSADGGSSDPARQRSARAELSAVIAVRSRELATVRKWAVPPVARQANALLASALEASLASDRDYFAWVGARIAGDTTRARAALAAAQVQDGRATSFKRTFLGVYNGLRKAAGLAPIPANFAF